MSNLLDDKSRFLAILELLSEKFVDDFVNYYLHNAYYPREYSPTLDMYARKKDEVLSAFESKKIEVARNQLNGTFDELNRFLINNFSTPNEHYRMHKNPPFLYLAPRIHHNFRLSEGGNTQDATKDSNEWNKLKQETDALAENFEKAYKNFVKIVKKEIESGQETKKKWWEKSWVQIVALIGALASIIGFLFLFSK